MSYEESREDYVTRSFAICTPHQNKSRRMRRAGHVARVGTGGVHRVLMGKPDGKRTLAKQRDRWEDNIKMVFSEVGWGHGMDWSGSVYGQVAGSCDSRNEPPSFIKYGEFLDQLRTGQLLKKDCAPRSLYLLIYSHSVFSENKKTNFMPMQKDENLVLCVTIYKLLTQPNKKRERFVK